MFLTKALYIRGVVTRFKKLFEDLNLFSAAKKIVCSARDAEYSSNNWNLSV